MPVGVLFCVISTVLANFSPYVLGNGFALADAGKVRLGAGLRRG